MVTPSEEQRIDGLALAEVDRGALLMATRRLARYFAKPLLSIIISRNDRFEHDHMAEVGSVLPRVTARGARAGSTRPLRHPSMPFNDGKPQSRRSV
jgi:hypothetical protein